MAEAINGLYKAEVVHIVEDKPITVEAKSGQYDSPNFLHRAPKIMSNSKHIITCYECDLLIEFDMRKDIYFVNQIKAFRDGNRNSALMALMAKGLSGL